MAETLRSIALAMPALRSVSFLVAVIEAAPIGFTRSPPKNGVKFADLPRNRDSWTARYRVHRFDQICHANGIEHQLTRPLRDGKSRG